MMNEKNSVDETIPEPDWNTYLRATILTQKEVDKLTAIDNYVKDVQGLVQRVEELGVMEYAELLQGVVSKISDTKHLYRLLFVIRTLMSSCGRFTDYFVNAGDSYSSLRVHMTKEEPVIVFNLYSCLGMVIEKKYEQESALATMKEVTETISKGISEGRAKGQYLCLASVRSLSYILQRPEVRKTFTQDKGPAKLLQIIQNFPNEIQLCYESAFCIWLLTYYLRNDNRIFEDLNVIPTLHQILKVHKKEKVIRIALLSLKNLLTESRLVSDFISVGGPKTLANIQKRNYDDEDIPVLLHELVKSTEDFIDELSTFAEYSQEVRSGQLEKSPTHDSQKFWIQNIDKFEENDFYILKELIKLLKSPNLQTQAIAIKDVGNFVIHHKDGRDIAARLGAKSIVMALMESSDEEVKSQAITCTQKIMLQNWQFLQQ